MDKKVYLCNRVVRCSKAQHTSEFALSLNRYHKIETLLFYSDTQLDTVFLTILCKDNANEREIKANFLVFKRSKKLNRAFRYKPVLTLAYLIFPLYQER